MLTNCRFYEFIHVITRRNIFFNIFVHTDYFLDWINNFYIKFKLYKFYREIIFNSMFFLNKRVFL